MWTSRAHALVSLAAPVLPLVALAVRSRSEVLSLLSSQRRALSSPSSAPPVHSLLLHGSVFQESSEAAMVEVQSLLVALVGGLEVLNASKSNVTGRLFYRGRTFRVHDPEKEHVSVEAVQVQAGSGPQSTSSGSTADSSSASAASVTTKSIVRDDHPPLIIGVRCDEDPDDDDEDQDDEDTDSSEGETNHDSSSSGSDSDTQATGEGVTHGSRRRWRRRRRVAQPEIIDLEQTPLADLLARQSSNPQINGSLAMGLATAAAHAGPLAARAGPSGASSSSALIPQTHNYYFYVRTLYHAGDETFLRYYVKLNWLRRLNWIDMSGTSISGYGVVSLIASCCSNIQCLFLAECAQLDNMGIYALVSLCTSLKQLDISNCPKVDRFGLMYLAELQLNVVQNSLEIIDVSHCGGNDVRTDPSSVLASPPPTSSSTSPLAGQLVSLALFNALEERGFRGRFIWQHTPKREEIVGDPTIIKVPVHSPPQTTSPTPTGHLAANIFAPPVQQYQYQLSSPFFQHYQLASHRILDLAMRDITAQVIVEVPWTWIAAQDAQRMERLRQHQLQLGPNGLGFVAMMEAELTRERVAGPPHFYALNLSGHLVNDRLLFYILANWGPRLYALTLDGTYITSAGLRELAHCPHLHVLSLTSCLNLIDKTRANAILKESLRGMPFLGELNLAHSRLSGRMMSSHPNLKLETLVANGCPISSFAIRMLASSAPAPPPGELHASQQQSMCKYSLRLLSLANCAFVNRKSLEYVFKFAYLSLLDVSDCRGLKRDDLVEGFLGAAEAEAQHMEAVVMGKAKSRAQQQPTNAATASSFGCMLCHLRHIVCFGIGGSFSEKRASEFARDLNTLAAKLQQLLLLHHHQLQAQLDAQAQALAAQQAHGAAENNLAPPPPIPVRSMPPPVPAFLRRDFTKDPIIVVANRAAPILARYQPTLTRFVLAPGSHQQPPTVVAVPSGLVLGAGGAGAWGGGGFEASPPPLFRGSSMLDECPYSFLPMSLPTANPPAAVPTSAAPQGTASTPPARGTQAFFHGALQPSVSATSLPSALPLPLQQSNSYMMMLNEQASGGTATATGTGTVGPGGVPMLPHSASVPSGAMPSGPGDLYAMMTPEAALPLRPAPSQHLSVEGLPGTSSSSSPGFVTSPVPGFAGLSLGHASPMPLPYAAVSSTPPFVSATLAMPTAVHASAPVIAPVPTASVPSHLFPQVSGLAPFPAPSAAGGAPIAAMSGGIPAPSFWSTLGPAPSSAAAASFVSPFAALQRPTAPASFASPAFPSPFPVASVSVVGVAACSTPEGMASSNNVTPSAGAVGEISPLQPGQPPSLPMRVASLPAASLPIPSHLSEEPQA